ncbi:MAG TPA: 50S ribosomal protein L11 methyltransferase [Gammaproteobacteria bacterium]|nr:50S ribosomal protein L11 methyltransferase [Gammaproteobacteria bacterium]
MPWLKITFAARKVELDELSSRLESAGAQSITIEDAEDRPLFDYVDGHLPVWDNSIISGLFDAVSGREAVLSALQSRFGTQELPEHQIEEIPDTDWERSWLDRYQPQQYGDRLWVCPTWHDAVDESATTLFLDPGLAFGSGTHETTSMCLKWLAEHPPVGQHVIDYGCGSGILAIASLKLGADSAIGIDIDPQALQASRANAEHNETSQALQLYLPADLSKPLKADLIFANILANTLLDLKDSLLAMRSEQGTLVLSGILKEQADRIRTAFSPGNTIALVQDGDWVMMTVEKTAE